MKVMALLVTYNPDIAELRRCIESICDQVQGIMLVDNASKKFEDIELCGKNYDVNILRNKKNLGIAEALNRGFDYARMHGYDWVLTLDQDSYCTYGIIEKFKKYTNDDNVGIVSALEIDRNSVKKKRIGFVCEEIDRCITAGSLIRIVAWEKVNGYDTRLFIDYVDFDFCMRLRIAHWKILRVNTAIIINSLGKSTNRRLLFHNVSVSNHSISRVYYLVRNWLYYIVQYHKNLNVLKELTKMLMYCIKTIVFSKNKSLVFKTIIKGMKDSCKIAISSRKQ